jgi:hypothetical protein
LSLIGRIRRSEQQKKKKKGQNAMATCGQLSETGGLVNEMTHEFFGAENVEGMGQKKVE